MEEDQENKKLTSILSDLMIKNVPSYANKIYYSLGFLSMSSFFLLIMSGLIMVFFGPTWWLTNNIGEYVRSIHLWATQAFILFIFLHLLIVFLTGGYRPPRRLTWVIGGLMLFIVLIEAELGYGLRGDFSSQWRVLQASDLYNGSGLGKFINNLNFSQIYGLHIVFFPIFLLSLLFFHYLLVKIRGIAKPLAKNASYTMVKAKHTVLFLRGITLIFVILLLARIFPSPLIIPTTIKDIAKKDPNLMANTLLKEFTHTSDTATYFDSIDPYTYDTAKVYIEEPYKKYIALTNQADKLTLFYNQNTEKQKKDVKQTTEYFATPGALIKTNSRDPLVSVISSLTLMAQSGLYEESNNPTYIERFLADTGVLEEKAQNLGMTTDQYGMIKEEKGILPPGAWWLVPVGLLDHTLLAKDDNQDRDGAEIIGILILFLLAFPYIPYLNKIPEKLPFHKIIQKN